MALACCRNWRIRSHLRLRREQAVGFLVASPNPAVASLRSPGRAAVTLEWTSAAAAATEVRFGRPDGPLLSHAGAEGKTKTGAWVGDGMIFYLQDVSDGLPLTLAGTLGVVRVHGERMSRVSIVGGMFGLDVATFGADGPLPSFLSGESMFLANGTSAMALLIRHLRPRRVWLPSYLCVALAIAVREEEARRASTRWTTISLCNPRPGSMKFEPRDAVVMVDYFGFLSGVEYADAVRARGASLIEDAAQALLSDGAGRQGDFAVFSPRKFLGVPDGGYPYL